MGKAAKKRIKGQKNYLARLATEAPDLFAEKWEKRIASRLREIKLAIAEWKRGGDAAYERVFGIVDATLEILAACGPEVYGQYAKMTYETLCHECCKGVAETTDSRLYRLSNFATLERQQKNRTLPR